MFFDLNVSNQILEVDKDLQLILQNKHDIMERYLKLRKLAISYWDFFSFSLGYCLVYPIIHRLSHNNRTKKIYVFCNVISSLVFSYVFYKVNLKYILGIFNKADYNKYVTFCKKYKMEEEYLF
jgi:hypothetical protein